MSNPGDDTLEGWAVPARPPLLFALVLLLLLATILFAGGKLYLARIAPGTRPPQARFPAPQLETVRTHPDEPHRPALPPPPTNIARAMAETARAGDALWGKARP